MLHRKSTSEYSIIDSMKVMRVLSANQRASNYVSCCQTRQSVLATFAFAGMLVVLSFRLEWHDTFATSADLSMNSISNTKHLRESNRQNDVAKILGEHEVGDTITSLLSTHEHAFEPENLQRTDKVPCGANKCFFPLKSDPTIGYLVAPSKRKSKEQSEQDWFKTLEASWELAEQLEHEYDIQQFLLEAPKNITISHNLAALLNRNLWRESRAKFETKERFPEQSIAFIQKVSTAPTPNLLFGCAHSKVQQFQREVDKFIPLIRRKKRFARHFRKYMDQARAIMRKEPCLVKDFQVLVDTKGRLYHLDFDRCFIPDDPGAKRAISEEVTRSCMDALDDIEKHFYRVLLEEN